MKSIGKLFLMISILFFQSCKVDCGECFSPPEFFAFELVDKVSSENLFTNGTLNSGDIEIINLADSTKVDYVFIHDIGFNGIELDGIGWKTETVNYSINVGKKHICKFYVNAERLNDRCCSYTVYNEIRIDDAEFILDGTTRIYKIMVE